MPQLIAQGAIRYHTFDLSTLPDYVSSHHYLRVRHARYPGPGAHPFSPFEADSTTRA
jgi:hypothetical protein